MNEREAKGNEIADRIRLNEHELQRLRDMQQSIHEGHAGTVVVLNVIADKLRAAEALVPTMLGAAEFERGRMQGKLDALRDLAGLRAAMARKEEEVAAQIAADSKALQSLRR